MDNQNNNPLPAAGEHFIQGLSRISNFWGFPKAMGAIFGAIYLTPTPINLDELVTLVGVSKGTVSTNVRQLERLGLIHKRLQIGDRKDYYEAEIDFWRIIRELLKERQNSEFERALRMVGESIEMLPALDEPGVDAVQIAFYRERMKLMQQFFDQLDSLVATVIALDNLRSGTLQKLWGRTERE